MPARRLRELLDAQKVKYVVISHSPAYTAQEVAESAHVSGKVVAKTVVMNVDGRMLMAVLPATARIRVQALKDALSAQWVQVATEDEFKLSFPDCEVGAMPPFGSLYGMEVWVDDRLKTENDIVFNAGSHREVFKMAYRDFERLAKPRHASFAEGV